MLKIFNCFVLSLFLLFSNSLSASTNKCNNFLDNDFKKLHSKDSVNLCESFNGKVILAVNTASRCGFTPQFKSLEALYNKYKDKGLVILGFPSNDFYQEHKDASKTAEVCYKNYGVTFPMMASSSVKGEQANPFFKAISQASGTSPKWNFFKYLISRDGKQVTSYSSSTTPDDKDLLKQIETLLAQK